MKKKKTTQTEMNTISGLIKNQDNIVEIKEEANKLKIIVKQDAKLGDALNYLPYGIINKNVTGIGATTLELKSDRHSIIVVPTKALAYGKYKNDTDKYLYVGSSITGKIEGTKPEDISTYIKRTDIRHKFLVVADSLPKLIKAFVEEGIDAYNQYYIMIDEVDIIQSDSTYRPALENVIDYYLKFKKENRSLVSATIKEFSHPVLQGERMVIIDYPDKMDRKIELIHTNNINKAVCEEISALLNLDDEKIIVAYNSVTEAHKIISLLRHNHQDISYGILCSESSAESAGEEHYTTLNDDKLENRVTFITSAYFVGVDINEKCHIVSVSTTEIPYTLLSVDKLTQIRGRCREGVLSESFIYDVKFDKKVNIEDFHSHLLEETKNVKELYNHFDKFQYKSVVGNFLLPIKNAIKDILTVEVFEGDKIQLTRKDIDGNFVESFFNIDAIKGQKYLKHNVFTRGERVAAYLKSNGIANSYEYKDYVFSESQEEQAKSINKMQREKIMTELLKHKSYIDTIGDYRLIGGMADEQLIELQNIYDERKYRMKPQIKLFYELVFLLRKYYPIKSLTKFILKPVAMYNKVGIRNIRRALVFHAMADNFPFKHMIINGFKIGSTYNKDEIEKILTEIYKTCHNNVPILIPESNMVFVQHLNCFFNTKRTREKSGERRVAYEIIGLKKLPQPIRKISLTDKRANEVIDINKLMAF